MFVESILICCRHASVRQLWKPQNPVVFCQEVNMTGSHVSSKGSLWSVFKFSFAMHVEDWLFTSQLYRSSHKLKPAILNASDKVLPSRPKRQWKPILSDLVCIAYCSQGKVLLPDVGAGQFFTIFAFVVSHNCVWPLYYGVVGYVLGRARRSRGALIESCLHRHCHGGPPPPATTTPTGWPPHWLTPHHHPPRLA